MIPQLCLVPQLGSASWLAAAGDPMSHVKDHVVWPAGAFLPFEVTIHMVFLVIAALVTCLFFTYVVARIRANGTGGRLGNCIEAILLFIRDDVSRPYMGKEGDKYLPILWSFFFFILTCNLIGLVPFAYTATSNLNLTAGLALVSFTIYHAIGIKQNGLVHYLKANLLVGPVFLWPIMIPVEILGHLLRPAALAIRLFANMVAGHTMLAVLLGFAALVFHGGLSIAVGVPVTVLSLGASVLLFLLEIFIGFLQAFIFTFLTAVFLSLAVHPDH